MEVLPILSRIQLSLRYPNFFPHAFGYPQIFWGETRLWLSLDFLGRNSVLVIFWGEINGTEMHKLAKPPGFSSIMYNFPPPEMV